MWRLQLEQKLKEKFRERERDRKKLAEEAYPTTTTDATGNRWTSSGILPPCWTPTSKYDDYLDSDSVQSQ